MRIGLARLFVFTSEHFSQIHTYPLGTLLLIFTSSFHVTYNEYLLPLFYVSNLFTPLILYSVPMFSQQTYT